jgi:hypothetical protein
MRVLKTLVLCGAVALVCAPTQARAEGYVSPWIGTNFSTTEGIRNCGLNDCGQGWSWGFDAGYMGAGVFGGEVDFGYSNNFFGDVVDNKLLDFMGNVIVGIPIGGQHGAGFRPFVTGGLGVIHTSEDAIGTTPASSDNDFAYNLGGGFMGYFSNHVGLRGDIKYLRTINSNTNNDTFAIGVGNFHYWRAGIGIVLR